MTNREPMGAFIITGTFMPEEKRNTSGAYQGSKYFSYNGEILEDIRKRFEAETGSYDE